jgi:hypothetical protein
MYRAGRVAAEAKSEPEDEATQTAMADTSDRHGPYQRWQNPADRYRHNWMMRGKRKSIDIGFCLCNHH